MIKSLAVWPKESGTHMITRWDTDPVVMDETECLKRLRDYRAIRDKSIMSEVTRPGTKGYSFEFIGVSEDVRDPGDPLRYLREGSSNTKIFLKKRHKR